jgi:hypothetical protein
MAELLLQQAEANTVKLVQARAVPDKQAQAEHRQAPQASPASCSVRPRSMSQICTKATPS